MLFERFRGFLVPGAADLDEGEAERRRALRKAVYLRATIYPIDIYSDVRIRDASSTGAKGEADVELAIGQILHLTTDEKAYHPGKVKWTNGRQFGLELPNALAILAEQTAEVDHGDRNGHHPRSQRIALDVSARLLGGRPPRPATVRNASATGLLIDTSPGLKPGQHLVVRIGDAPSVYGRVQWSGGSRLGMKALNAISVPALHTGVV